MGVDIEAVEGEEGALGRGQMGQKGVKRGVGGGGVGEGGGRRREHTTKWEISDSRMCTEVNSSYLVFAPRRPRVAGWFMRQSSASR